MSPNSPPLRFGHLQTLIALASQLQRYLDRGLKDEGHLNADCVRVLMFIAQHSDADQRCIANDIIQATALPDTSVKRMLKKLMQDGLIVERGDGALGSDERRNPLTITGKGDTALDNARREWERIVAEALGEVDRGALKALSVALDALHGAPMQIDRLFRLEGSKDWQLRR